jgi:hypothetical protein
VPINGEIKLKAYIYHNKSKFAREDEKFIANLNDNKEQIYKNHKLIYPKYK